VFANIVLRVSRSLGPFNTTVGGQHGQTNIHESPELIAYARHDTFICGICELRPEKEEKEKGKSRRDHLSNKAAASRM
jgi:hypothetical protein